MAADGCVDWRCACGGMTARLHPRGGTRLVCYCRHCRAFLRHLGHPEMLEKSGGSDLFQVAPHRFEIVTGGDRLACLRLTGKGPLRWYAACCGTPVANTLATPALPFASVSLGAVPAAARPGPVRARVFTEFATGPVPGGKHGVARVMAGAAIRAAGARLTGAWRRTPFFDAAGRPVAPVARLTEAERDRAYAGG